VNKANLDAGDRPSLRFHDLRHTFASLVIASGGNVVFVSRQLGHASPDITLRVYVHLFDAAEHANRASAALEQGFGAVLDGNGVETAAGNQPQTGGAEGGAYIALLRDAGTTGN
jgi:Phage integrase family